MIPVRPLISLILLAVVCPILALAQIDPLRSADQLWGPRPEILVRVRPLESDSSRVLIADYDLIRRDFAEVSLMSDAQIDSWLIRNTSFISKNQAKQKVVTSEIPRAQNSQSNERARPSFV